MKRNLLILGLIALLVAGFAAAYLLLTPANQRGSMGMDEAAGGPTLPAVPGYAEGQAIRFVHPEASDPEIAQMLTTMIDSPVLVVPVLAQAPETMLANVYVFTNGVTPEGAMGPLGFQPDVFDNPPGTESYSPLRSVYLVTWQDEEAARVLMSAAEVQAAVENGELVIEQPGIVVNMPFLTWPDGHR